jgi:hypothetical protein
MLRIVLRGKGGHDYRSSFYVVIVVIIQAVDETAFPMVGWPPSQ